MVEVDFVIVAVEGEVIVVVDWKTCSDYLTINQPFVWREEEEVHSRSTRVVNYYYERIAAVVSLLTIPSRDYH